MLLVVGLWWAPGWLLDALLACNLGLSVGLVLWAMYTPRPVSCSGIPGLLLLTTLLRLALNLAVTRLLWCGGGGESWLIPAFGHALMGERVWLGTIFCVLLLVAQWVMTPGGLLRIAQVNARYTLDCMPGQQMGVDADLYGGVIDEQTAQLRRRELEREADFYAAMDGLSRYVRGDSLVAGLALLINLLGRDVHLCLGNAVLVTLCAALVTLAMSLLVTRAAAQANLGDDFAPALEPRFLVWAASLVFVVEVLRFLGAAALPAPPLLVISGTLHLGMKALRGQRRALVEARLWWGDADGTLVVEVPRSQVHSLLEQIPRLRRELAEQLGFLLPGVLVRLRAGDCRICWRGSQLGSGSGKDCFLLLSQLARTQAALLLDAPQLLQGMDLRGLSSDQVEQVLSNLLEQGVSIRKLEAILDCMAEHPSEPPEQMTERVRVHLSRTALRRTSGVLEVTLLDCLDEAGMGRLRDGDVLMTSARFRLCWRRLTLTRFPRLQVVTPTELVGTAITFRRA